MSPGKVTFRPQRFVRREATRKARCAVDRYLQADSSPFSERTTEMIPLLGLANHGDWEVRGRIRQCARRRNRAAGYGIELVQSHSGRYPAFITRVEGGQSEYLLPALKERNPPPAHQICPTMERTVRGSLRRQGGRKEGVEGDKKLVQSGICQPNRCPIPHLIKCHAILSR